MFVCIHYNRNATKIYKYVEMNIFCILYKMYIAKISLACIMEAEPKIFLNLFQLSYNNIIMMLLYIMLPIYI